MIQNLPENSPKRLKKNVQFKKPCAIRNSKSITSFKPNSVYRKLKSQLRSNIIQDAIGENQAEGAMRNTQEQKLRTEHQREK